MTFFYNLSIELEQTLKKYFVNYKEEINYLIKIIFYKVVKNMKSIYKMLLLFDNLGSVSKENYNYYYYGNTENYELNLKMLKGFDYRNYFVYYTWYVFATALAPYLYCKYKNDKSFMKTIIHLHTSINNKSIMDCLSEIGLTDFNFNEINECINNIMNHIDSIKTL